MGDYLPVVDVATGLLPRGLLQSPPDAALQPPGSALEPLPLMALGFGHTCAASASGDVLCWGSNTDGQLAVGSTDGTLAPTQAANLGLEAGVVVLDMDSGQDHTCAVFSTGGVKCWGANGYGQLRLGDVGTDPLSVGRNMPYVDLTSWLRFRADTPSMCG